MTAKRLFVVLSWLALVAVVALGLSQLINQSATTERLSSLTVAQMQARLAGSGPPFSQLHAQASRLLSADSQALQGRLNSLRGHPVVLNKWASWCEPCRSEFGVFQHASVDLGRKVAFIGLDSNDSSRADAAAFLRSFPVSYPSYFDKSGNLGRQITYSSSMPVTVFYDAGGRQYIHQGPYLSLAKLEYDVKRYALGR